MAKMGRPLAENPKNHKVTIRMTDEEYARLQIWAEEHGMTQANVLRLAIEELYKSNYSCENPQK